MRLERIWDYPALATFYKLRMEEAAAVDRATLAFAERGEGKLGRQGPHWVLRAGSHIAVLAIDREAGTVTILSIHRAYRW